MACILQSWFNVNQKSLAHLDMKKSESQLLIFEPPFSNEVHILYNFSLHMQIRWMFAPF